MPNRVIIFDADGVVIIPERKFSQTLCEELSLTPADTAAFFSGPFLECLVGKADLKQELEPYLKKWGWSKSSEEFLSWWFDSEAIVNQVIINEVERLRSRGFTVCLATNQEQYRTNYLKNEMGLGTHFDHIFSSAELGVRKPQRAFFERIAEHFSISDPSQLLLIDDTAENVKAAHQAGWKAHFYQNNESTLRALNDVLDRPVTLSIYAHQPSTPLSIRTLCFLLRENQVLLGLKKKGFGQGKYVGIGGKVESGEGIEQAVIREVEEEIEVTPTKLIPAGVVNFYFPYQDSPIRWNQQGNIYLTTSWTGQIQETAEIAPQWWEITALPYDQMWPDAVYWLELALRRQLQTGVFLYTQTLQLEEVVLLTR
ncbi:MAG TPA: HAD-IA family hydrolase [Vitreimonas sp.]|nr:HAD-IA family hydrolase [Vitreimonas sp.]